MNLPDDFSSAAFRLSSEEKALVDELVADGLEIQHKFRPEPLYKQTLEGHYEGGAVEKIQRAQKNERPRAKR